VCNDEWAQTEIAELRSSLQAAEALAFAAELTSRKVHAENETFQKSNLLLRETVDRLQDKLKAFLKIGGDDVYIAEQEKALKALAELTELRAVHERCGADALQMRSALSRVEFELAELKSAYQRLETSFIASQDAHSKAMHQAKTRESALISRETELLKRSAVVLEERSELQKFNVSLKQSLADTRSQLLILQTNAASVSGALTIAQDAALARALEAEAAAKLVVDLQARITAFTSALAAGN